MTCECAQMREVAAQIGHEGVGGQRLGCVLDAHRPRLLGAAGQLPLALVCDDDAAREARVEDSEHRLADKVVRPGACLDHVAEPGRLRRTGVVQAPQMRNVLAPLRVGVVLAARSLAIEIHHHLVDFLRHLPRIRARVGNGLAKEAKFLAAKVLALAVDLQDVVVHAPLNDVIGHRDVLLEVAENGDEHRTQLGPLLGRQVARLRVRHGVAHACFVRRILTSRFSVRTHEHWIYRRVGVPAFRFAQSAHNYTISANGRGRGCRC